MAPAIPAPINANAIVPGSGVLCTGGGESGTIIGGNGSTPVGGSATGGNGGCDCGKNARAWPADITNPNVAASTIPWSRPRMQRLVIGGHSLRMFERLGGRSSQASSLQIQPLEARSASVVAEAAELLIESTIREMTFGENGSSGNLGDGANLANRLAKPFLS
jgi:hypothetical protein